MHCISQRRTPPYGNAENSTSESSAPILTDKDYCWPEATTCRLDFGCAARMLRRSLGRKPALVYDSYLQYTKDVLARVTLDSSPHSSNDLHYLIRRNGLDEAAEIFCRKDLGAVHYWLHDLDAVQL